MRVYLFFLITLYGCNHINSNDELDNFSSLNHLFLQLEKDGLFNGEVLITKGNNELLRGYYGLQDLDNETAFADNAIFEIASLSKPFTALAFAKLVSDQQLSYTDDVKKYIPELPYDSISIKHLINHTSGLPDYNEVLYPYWDYNTIANNQDLLDLLIEHKPELRYLPGEKWKYSNTGYTLLALLIERITGESYPEYLSHQIFLPLKMTSTIIPDYREASILTQYVKDYVYSLGKATYMDPGIWPSYDNATFTSDMYGAQGICSNAHDLSKFLNIFDSQKLLSDTIFDLYLQPQNLTTPMSDDFTMGWFYDRDTLLGLSYFYVGGFSGYRALLQCYPSTGISIILLSNTSTTPIWKIKRMVSQFLSKQEVEYPRQSFVRYLGQQIRKHQHHIQDWKPTFHCDTSQFEFRPYEWNELMDDYKLNNEYELIKVAIEKTKTYYPGKIKVNNK